MPPSDYERLLETTDISDRVPTQALRHLGTLIDLAHTAKDARGSERAIELAAGLELGPWASKDRAALHFFLSNAWSDLRSRRTTTPKEAWAWNSPEGDASLLALRKSVAEEGFVDLVVEDRCKILTNLGNGLSTIGRYIEAMEFWNRALGLNADFPMALANRWVWPFPLR